MSLLDELARNSYSLDFDLQQLLGQTPSPTRSKQYCREITTVTQSLPPFTEVVNSQQQGSRQISISTSLNAVSIKKESQYYVRYRERVTKINNLVSLLSTKNRKIMYQFFVRLERYVKDALAKPPKITEEQQKVKIEDEIMPANKYNQPLLFATLEPVVNIIKGKEKAMLRQGFSSIHRIIRSIMKTQFLANCLENMHSQRKQSYLSQTFILIKMLAQKEGQIKERMSLAKGIFLLGFGKAASIRTNCHQSPLNFLCTVEASQQPLKIPSLYPQKTEQQSKDYCDTMALFMNQEEHPSSIVNSRVDDSFVGNVCVSAYFDKNTLSPRSCIKNLSDIQFTSIPQSAVDKRRVSDFTASVGQSRVDVYSHLQERNEVSTGMNPTRSQVSLHNQSRTKDIFLEEQQQNYGSPKEKAIFDPFTNLGQRQSGLGDENKEPMLRSQSELKISKTERKSMGGRKDEIEVCYHEEMNRYMKFKRSLLERRRSTLKDIQKSQEVIKRLMQKYDDPKNKTIKPKVTLNNNKTREGSYKNSSKTSQVSSKKSTPVKRSPRKIKADHNIKQMSLFIKDRTQQKVYHEQYGNHQICPNNDSPRNMEVFSLYMSEKKKMLPEKSPSSKKSSKNKSHVGSTGKKTDKKTNTSAARKSILALSSFPAPKEQRLDLKLDLARDSGKKATHPGVGRQSFKHGGQAAHKQKSKLPKK